MDAGLQLINIFWKNSVLKMIDLNFFTQLQIQ